jgi:hypothetical protein
MRKFISNAIVITGDGKTVLPDHSVVIEKGIVVDEQIAQEAVYIGETGVPCAAYGAPQISRELNRTLTVAQVQEIKEAALGVGIDPDAFDRNRMETALKSAGLDDLISTDYIGGAWDPIPLVLSKAIEAGLISLPKAVQITSASVVHAIPRLGAHRAAIAPGNPADLAMVAVNDISQVKMVLVAGEIVARNGRPCYPGCRR